MASWNSIPCPDREKCAPEGESPYPEFRDKGILPFPTLAVSQPSELVSQCELHFSRFVDSVENRAKRAIRGSYVRGLEDVAVERVDEGGLQREGVGFRQAQPLDDREILGVGHVTSDLAPGARHVAQHISPLSDQSCARMS